MYNILHMSDIHYGKNIALEKKRLSELVKWINDEKITVKFLIFTGDMIDAREVTKECINKLKEKYTELNNLKKNATVQDVISIANAIGKECCNEYNRLVKDISRNIMQEAGMIFKRFAEEINVDSSHIVLCCGNHDCLYYTYTLPHVTCEDRIINKDELEEKFSAYDDLCKILNENLSYETQTYDCDGVTFIIANSNWGGSSESSHYMCVDCHSIETIIQELDKKNRSNCYFIAHKPSDDFCESTKYPYKENEHLTMMQKIERISTAFFYGDKHAYLIKNNSLKEFMCGDPISQEGVRYNLVRVDDRGEIESSYFITQHQNTWSKSATNTSMEGIYNISKKYLKPYAFNLLYHLTSIPEHWDDAMKVAENAIRSEAIIQASKMFSSCCEISPIQLEDDITIFEHLVQLIKNSGKMQAIAIKGYSSVGKSTLATILYLFTLREFYLGKIDAMPFYFDFRILINDFEEKDNKNVNAFISYCVEKFKEHLDSCIQIARTHNRPLWIFVAGLESCRLLDAESDAIEKNVYKWIESSLSAFDKDKYLMCLNLHNYGIDTSFDQINQFENVCYINPLRIIPYKNKEVKLKTFLCSYLSLNQNDTSSESVNNTIEHLARLHFIDVDLSFMHNCLNEISSLSTTASTWSMLEKNAKILENLSNEVFRLRIEKIQKMAGMMYSERRRYIDLIKEKDLADVTIAEYLNLCHHPLILKYLISRYYVNELIYYSDSTTEIPKDSILNCFITHDIAVTIRVILYVEYRLTARTNLEHFIEKHSLDSNGYLYSMIAYLCGHLKTDGGMELLDKMDSINITDSDFFSLCKKRSFELARIVCSDDWYAKEKFILELMNDDRYRLFNRTYQLYYYGDTKFNSLYMRESWSFVPRKDRDAFDFRATFLTLLSKLEESIKGRYSYPLQEVDLYTICDLIYSRLHNVSSRSLFYCEKYNEKGDSVSEAVLNRTIELLERYTKVHGYKRNNNEQIAAYFEFMKDKFSETKKKVAKAAGQNVNIPYVSEVYDFQKVCELNKLIRVGWKINTKTISGKRLPISKIERSKNSYYETVLEHVMETVYIAQMFLPEHTDLQGYDKHIVISILLYADLGRSFTGDYSPIYSNVRLLNHKEDVGLSYFLTLGTLDGYANQPKYFNIVRDRKSSDINVQIAWEIKKIQTEYKYYSLYDQLKFNDERRKDFESDFEEPLTDICKHIREVLILKNPNFQQYL